MSSSSSSSSSSAAAAAAAAATAGAATGTTAAGAVDGRADALADALAALGEVLGIGAAVVGEGGYEAVDRAIAAAILDGTPPAAPSPQGEGEGERGEHAEEEVREGKGDRDAHAHTRAGAGADTKKRRSRRKRRGKEKEAKERKEKKKEKEKKKDDGERVRGEVEGAGEKEKEKGKGEVDPFEACAHASERIYAVLGALLHDPAHWRSSRDSNRTRGGVGVGTHPQPTETEDDEKERVGEKEFEEGPAVVATAGGEARESSKEGEKHEEREADEDEDAGGEKDETRQDDGTNGGGGQRALPPETEEIGDRGTPVTTRISAAGAARSSASRPIWSGESVARWLHAWASDGGAAADVVASSSSSAEAGGVEGRGHGDDGSPAVVPPPAPSLDPARLFVLSLAPAMLCAYLGLDDHNNTGDEDGGDCASTCENGVPATLARDAALETVLLCVYADEARAREADAEMLRWRPPRDGATLAPGPFALENTASGALLLGAAARRGVSTAAKRAPAKSAMAAAFGAFAPAPPQVLLTPAALDTLASESSEEAVFAPPVPPLHAAPGGFGARRREVLLAAVLHRYVAHIEHMPVASLAAFAHLCAAAARRAGSVPPDALAEMLAGLAHLFDLPAVRARAADALAALLASAETDLHPGLVLHARLLAAQCGALPRAWAWDGVQHD